MYSLIGISAHQHENCGIPDVPEVFSRVHSYLDWIEGLIWGD